MQIWDDFEEEYRDLVDDVVNANSSTYELKLGDFLGLLEKTEWSRDYLDSLTHNFDFDTWYENSAKSTGSMVGSGSIKWAEDRNLRLAQQLALFKHFSISKGAYSEFTLNFMYAGTNFTDMIREINDQIFTAFSRDLFKQINKYSKVESKGFAEPSPDRIVTINKNSEYYTTLLINIDKIKDAALKSNELLGQQPKESGRIISELDASKELLKSETVRANTLWLLLGGALFWLADKFASQAIEPVIGNAIALLKLLIGI